MIDLSEILPKLVTASNDNEQARETAVKVVWTRVAGPGLRQQVVPFRLYHKTLIVAVADAIWQRQLHRMSSEFVSRINRLLGHKMIDTIEFRIDPVTLAQSRHPSGVSKQTSPLTSVPLEVISAAGEISDLDLRQRFIRAAQNCMTRRDVRSNSIG